MLEIFSGWVGLLAAIITLLGLMFGPTAWPSISSWAGRVLSALLYPFKSTERRVLELYKKNEEVHENIKNISKKLDEVMEQFRPNGGSSIKDSLNRIELKQASNENITNFLINSLSVPMFKTDSLGLFTWVSKTYLDIASRDLEELIDWGWLSCIHEEDVDRVRTRWKHSIEEKRIYEDKYRIVTPQGGIILVQAKAAPTFFNNKIAGWVGALEIIK